MGLLGSGAVHPTKEAGGQLKLESGSVISTPELVGIAVSSMTVDAEVGKKVMPADGAGVLDTGGRVGF